MFCRAKRFEPIPPPKSQSKVQPKKDELDKPKNKVQTAPPKAKSITTPLKKNCETQSQCSSASSVKSFVTPKPIKNAPVLKAPSSIKKAIPPKSSSVKNQTKALDEIIRDQEVEIRNKDQTISECNKHIDELKRDLANLQKQLKHISTSDYESLNEEISRITLDDKSKSSDEKLIAELKNKILELHLQCEKLEEEVSGKQVELSSLEEVITIRDSLCKDLQEKLTDVETTLEETHQRLEMVKGHHSLALEANESIRREYKVELEALKSKFEEEKQLIISKSKADQENIKVKYNSLIESLKSQMLKEKEDIIHELQDQLTAKDLEMKAKIEQIEETAHEKLRLCEIQFEERTQNVQDHWTQQQNKIHQLEKEVNDLHYSISLTEEQNIMLQKDVNSIQIENEALKKERSKLVAEADEMKEEYKKKFIDFENEINKLTVSVDRVTKDKNKFEMSLSVTRDIVQVLTMRLRDSDNELENLEAQVQSLSNAKELLENELASYKNTLNTTIMECNEYKDALVNILKSKAALAKEHTRMMEHNVTLIESLQNVEKEAYRELGTIKNELIEDVEIIKKESKSQIQMLREEVEKKRMLCELATEHAGQATAAAEQSRVLLAQAASEISRLETENQRLQQQIEDQQSLVVELSLLRQENEELSMTVAKQTSLMEKIKKDMDGNNSKPKSPSVIRKMHKVGKENVGKENIQVIVSPLRERNH